VLPDEQDRLIPMRAQVTASQERRRQHPMRGFASNPPGIETRKAADLDLLQQIRVASPCSASWEEMGGDDCVRFCEHCRLNVYNLSAMSSAEAAALVREKEGRLCTRYHARADGTMLVENCPVGFR